MRIITNIEEAISTFRNSYNCACIGNFDGVHKGHQELISRAVKDALENLGISIVITFNNNTKILNGEKKFLTTFYEKSEIIKAIGADYIYSIDFPDSISELSPEAFVEKVLYGILRVKKLFVGENFRFGHNRVGDSNTLKKLGGDFSFDTEILKLIKVNGMVVNSTIARTAVLEGRVDICSELLGYPYFIRGIVGMGKMRGKNLVVPTANIYNIDEAKLIPKYGVYSTITIINGNEYFSLTNIGPQPTFQDEEASIESYILNFQKDIYGKEISTLFLRRLRDVKKFDTSTELKEQIERDKNEAIRDYEKFTKNLLRNLNLLNWLK